MNSHFLPESVDNSQSNSPIVSKPKLPRFLLIDALRGIAALAVVGFHFYRGSPLQANLTTIFPSPISFLLSHGALGVEIFFIISGFVIAHSLSQARITYAFVKIFIIRRLIRLTLPYWTIIFITVVVKLLSNIVFIDRVDLLPEKQSILAHIFYLQDILNINQISPVFWTLCLEVQFYLFFLLLCCFSSWLQQQFAIKSILVPSSLLAFIVGLPLSYISIVCALEFIRLPIPGTLIPYWHLFFIGVTIYWVAFNFVKRPWLLLVGLPYFLAIISHSRSLSFEHICIILITGVIIYVAASRNKLHLWLRNDWLQYLGKISYSLYLTHVLFGSRLINLGYRLNQENIGWALTLFILAVGFSLFVAHYFFLIVEKPTLNLSKQFSLAKS